MNEDTSSKHKKAHKYLAIVIAILVGLIICGLGFLLGSGKTLSSILGTSQSVADPESVSVVNSDDETVDTSPTPDPVPQIDEEILKRIPENSGYKVVRDRVYYAHSSQSSNGKLLRLSAEQAEYLGGGYIKDAMYVYLNGEVVLGADPAKCTKETVDQCGGFLGWQGVFAPYELEVTWNEVPIDAKDILPSTDWGCSDGQEVGVVNNGSMAGGKVLVKTKSEEGMWCSSATPPKEINHFVYFENYLVPISVESGFSFADLRVRVGEGFTWDSDWWGEDYRGHIINIPNSDYWLERGTTVGFRSVRDFSYADEAGPYYSYSSTSPPLMEDPLVGPIYRSYGDCFVSTRPDHIAVSYRLGFDYIDASTGVLDITLLDGTKNEEAYSYIPSYHSCYSLVKEEWLRPNERLIKVGELPNGDEVYALSEYRDEHLVAKYEDPNTLASYNGGENKYSYDEYLSYNPYLYWQDPFGGWVQFMNKRFETAAEKCKPVVYLYPEKTGDFSVFVEPNAGFTKTIPDYGAGWHVTATPDSQITDKASGETYPYLYWSGINTDIPEITEGWIVDQSDTERFLVEKLQQLGMNEQEIFDFNEYWIDRFETEGADQYKIMFLPQHLFEPLSPLTVEGDDTPDTIIRVMMYAQPATEGETLPEQVLPPTPERVGFTVTEWGGALFN